MNRRNGANRIDKVCKSVLELRESDFEEMEIIYKEQKAYCHPFKNATAKRQHRLGEHNEKVIVALKALCEAIKEGESI